MVVVVQTLIVGDGIDPDRGIDERGSGRDQQKIKKDQSPDICELGKFFRHTLCPREPSPPGER